MSPEISLQDLIDKIKSDLFSPYGISPISRKIIYPLFLVDQVEVELNVSITYEAGTGIKISIPQLAEASLDGKASTDGGHSMKIILKPILSSEQMRDLLGQDKHLMDGITEASLAALRKGTNLAGQEE